MNAQASPMFRGGRQIDDIVERMKPLAAWLQSFRPDCKVMTVSRRDLETLCRYPEAAQMIYDITPSSDGALYWRGFELRAEPVPPNPKPPIRP